MKLVLVLCLFLSLQHLKLMQKVNFILTATSFQCQRKTGFKKYSFIFQVWDDIHGPGTVRMEGFGYIMVGEKSGMVQCGREKNCQSI